MGALPQVPTYEESVMSEPFGTFPHSQMSGELPFLEGLLCAGLNTFISDSCHDPGSSGIKPRLREQKSLAQGHKMSEWQNSVDLNPGADAWENGHWGWQRARAPDLRVLPHLCSYGPSRAPFPEWE